MSDCQMLSPEMELFQPVLEVKAYQEGIPLRGTFELTARCNFNCNMCYVHLNEKQIRATGRELTNEEWLEIARQAKAAGMLYLTLTGGEVFARPRFRELYEELSKMGFLLQILSNGYLVDESVMAWLKECPPYLMRFTLYGACNETYEAVCGCKDGFERVSHAIDLVKEAGIPFYMTGTIVKENAADLPEMYRFAREKGVQFQHTIAVVNPVRGATADARSHRIDMVSLPPEAFLNVKKRARIYPKTKHILERCTNYRKSFEVTWNGKMVLCSFMQMPSVCLLEYPLAEAWQELLQELERLQMPDECRDCRYEGFCQNCPGMLAAECGAADCVTEAFCEKAKVFYENCCSCKEE